MILELLSTILVTALTAFVYFLFYWKMKLSINFLNLGGSSANQKKKEFLNNGKMPPVYPNGWFNLIESSALKIGEVKHIAILGQNFAVFRTKMGKVCVLDAYCPHLGANLAEGGVLKDDELECPFHAWRFCGKTGQCTYIPGQKNVPQTFKTKVWECVEVNGLIYVWYHAESAPPSWWPKQIKQISNGSWKYQGQSEYILEGHVQDFLEDAADQGHFNVVHDLNSIARFCHLGKIFNHTWMSIKWSTHSENDSTTRTRLSEMHEISDILEYDLGEKHKSLIIIDYAISILKIPVVSGQAPSLLNLIVGPGCIQTFVRTPLGYVCMIHSVTPIKPKIHRVSHLVYAPTILAPISKIAMGINYFTICGDSKIWKFKKYQDRPMLLKEDRYVKQFRKWYSQFYSENSPTYESCKNSIEW